MEKPAALRACVKEYLEGLAQAVDAKAQDAGFREALRAMAMFWQYSLLNQYLILIQRPDATHVMARLKWEALERKVKRGEVPILVRAPTHSGADSSFIGVPVFDIHQTTGRRLPKLELCLRGGSHHWRKLEDAARILGVEVAYCALPMGIRGRSLGGRVEVLPALPGAERTAVLAHELAHEVLHQAEARRAEELQRPGPKRTNPEEETEADATAFVIMMVLGLPSKAPTYIAWQGGTGLSVMRSMTRIQRAAKTILEAAASGRSDSHGPESLQ